MHHPSPSNEIVRSGSVESDVGLPVSSGGREWLGWRTAGSRNRRIMAEDPLNRPKFPSWQPFSGARAGGWRIIHPAANGLGSSYLSNGIHFGGPQILRQLEVCRVVGALFRLHFPSHRISPAPGSWRAMETSIAVFAPLSRGGPGRVSLPNLVLETEKIRQTKKGQNPGYGSPVTAPAACSSRPAKTEKPVIT